MPPKEETSIELQERLQSLKDQISAIEEDEANVLSQNDLKASLLFELGKTEKEAGNLESALPHLEQSAELQEEESIEQAEVYLELSSTYLGLSKLSEAKNLATKAIETFNRQQEMVLLNRATRQLALVYVQQGKIKEAEILIQQKIEQTTASENWKEAGKFYGFAGELASAQKDYQIAFNHFRNGIKALKKTNKDFKTIGEYYDALGRLLLHFKKQEEAIHSFEKSAEAYREANEPLLQGGLLVMISKVWEGEGKYLQGIPYLRQAAEAFQLSEDESAAMQTADAYYQAAYLYEQVKQWENALEQYKAALPFAQKTEDEMMVASIEDSIEQCEEKLNSKSRSKSSKNKGLFGKLKDLFS